MKPRCSRWVVCGFVLLVFGLLAAVIYYWYASNYISDLPLRHVGKNIYLSPRGDAHISAVFGAVVAIAISFLVSLVGVIRGPRNWVTLC